MQINWNQFHNQYNFTMAKEEEENPKRSELQKKLKSIFKRLKINHKLVPEKLEPLINESHHTLSKYKIGKIPKKDLKSPEAILIKLENLEKELDANKPIVPYTRSNENDSSIVNEGGIDISGTKVIQCIYLPMHLKPVPYHGKLKVTGIPTIINRKEAILAYPNDPEEFPGAEGQLIIYDAAAEHLNGSKIAVARIQVEDCAWGSLYYIIDKSNQSYLRKIYQGTNGNYRLEAMKRVNHPDKPLDKSKIWVVFRIIGFVIRSQPAIFQSFISN